MNLVGLSTTAFVSGLAALLVALGAMHLLRVRMRRQVVDSLLFFRTAALQARPRVLGRKLSRLGTFLLAAALLAFAWTAFAEPFGSDAAPSRVLVIDRTDAARATTASGTTLAAQFAADAANLVASSSLGPRGLVIAVGPTTRGILRADEPVALLVDRIEAMPIGGAPSRIDEALVDAAHALRDGDELVLFGGPALVPATLSGIPVRRAAAPAAAAITAGETNRSPRLRVFAETDLPPAIALTLTARGDVDLVALADAEVAIVRADSTVPSTLPSLRIETRFDGRLTEAQLRSACDAPLSLRDRARGERAAFRPTSDETTWVADPRNEFAVVSAGPHHVRAAAWWFDDLAHRDVPLLIDAALRHLAAEPDAFTYSEPARLEQKGDTLASLSGSGALAPLLLALALVALAIDAFLLGRARVA